MKRLLMLLVSLAIVAAGCGAKTLPITGSLTNRVHASALNELGAYTNDNQGRALTDSCSGTSCTVQFRADKPVADPVREVYQQAGDVLQAVFGKTAATTLSLNLTGPVSTSAGDVSEGTLLSMTMTRSSWSRVNWKQLRPGQPQGIRGLAATVNDSALN